MLRSKENSPLCALYIYNFIFFSRREFKTTNKEEKAIAAEAIIGESSIPKNGYKIPAATGIPKIL